MKLPKERRDLAQRFPEAWRRSSMQFHLNGFRTGDPAILEPLEGAEIDAAGAPLPDKVDVLIVGCGPAGLTLAAQLSAFPDITTRIVEQKDGPLQLGQADGVACRTMEMFNAFDFADRVMKEAYWVNETTFWKPDGGAKNRIARGGRIEDTEDGLSEFPHVILNQARVHDFYLDVMRRSPRRLQPDYSRRLMDVTIDETASDHPVTVWLERIDAEHAGQVEVVKARYVVGCDGARSGVRKSLGQALKGDSANQAWGVMDVLAVTDFPDIRLKAAIHSATEGSILIIPREGGYLVRLYIELDKLNADERVADRNLTADTLVAAAKRIIHPYTLDVKEIAWWSFYEIGQRLTDRFDDIRGGGVGTRTPRVFIAGDACHTHSPKAGQGMNVSMQDTFNLGWKLAAVLRGQAAPDLLDTYSAERHAIAKELIDFDRDFARMFSARPKEADDDAEGIDPAEFQRYFVKQGRFTAGTATRYRPSAICAEPTHQRLAEGLPIGMRFHSAPVVRLADAKPLQLGHVVKADGRWRLFAFAGAEDPAAAGSTIRALCDFLSESPASPIRRYTASGEDIDSVIDVRAVFQNDHRTLALDALPPLLLPAKGRYGLRDYEKMFCADLSGGKDIFDLRGIDRTNGCIVVVRPDQYVAHVLPLDAHRELSAFFDGFMLPQG
jgi:2-polyprenyl-6-methoxyphenol hydroxylase-like FAD-dependent oxidoreductase